MITSTLVRRAFALAAVALAGCASFQTAETPEAAFVVVGEGGAAVARVITSGANCPAITLDGHTRPMAVRSPLAPIPTRPANTGQPASSAVLTCEAAIPAGTAQASVGGQALPLPRGAANRIVVIGDTGCRLKKAELQDCNDPEAFPFARIAASAAAWKPDLVVHVGDYHYREDSCSANRPGCAGSPWGYGWNSWNADFFAPGRALLQAAPWVMARGNHESCARAGQGYWRYLDPRPLAAGRDCDNPANDGSGDYSDPYAVPLGHAAQLIVFDTSNTNYKGLPPRDPRWEKYADTWRKIDALSRQANYNIAVDHHPLFAYGPAKTKTGEVTLFGGDKGLLDAFGALDPGFLPKNISVLLSGHVHLWEQISFSNRFPTQFVTGFSGTDEEAALLPATVPAGAKPPAPGAVVEHMSSWNHGFGFMTMERTGADSWRVLVFDRDGKERNSCTVSGSKSVCAVQQVR
jgi:hypothetical protein